jgi:hypothetical protein
MAPSLDLCEVEDAIKILMRADRQISLVSESIFRTGDLSLKVVRHKTFRIRPLPWQIWPIRSDRDLCRTTVEVKPPQTSAVQRHRSTFSDLCREKAAVWVKKAEVCEGAGGFLAVLLKDLECFY